MLPVGAKEWVNPMMDKWRICSYPRCFYHDTDTEIIMSHYTARHLGMYTVHVVAREVVVDGVTHYEDASLYQLMAVIESIRPGEQVTLLGSKLSVEDRQLLILRSIPLEEQVVCPFCLEVQPSRATRMFNDDGVTLSKMVHCAMPTCHKVMRGDSMKIPRASPRDFGFWVGKYKGFWKEVEDTGWSGRLRAFYHNNKEMSDQFWQGYGEAVPAFAEKQRIKQAERDYQAASQENKK